MDHGSFNQFSILNKLCFQTITLEPFHEKKHKVNNWFNTLIEFSFCRISFGISPTPTVFPSCNVIIVSFVSSTLIVSFSSMFADGLSFALVYMLSNSASTFAFNCSRFANSVSTTYIMSEENNCEYLIRL